MHTISILRNNIYAYLCIQSFSKQFTDDYLSTHLYGQEARKVFVQHPSYNIEVFLKRANDGCAIINRRWAKVAQAFNFLGGSIFAFCFDNFPDEIHLSIYRLWYYRFGASVLWLGVLAASCTVISVIMKTVVTIPSILKIYCVIYIYLVGTFLIQMSLLQQLKNGLKCFR